MADAQSALGAGIKNLLVVVDEALSVPYLMEKAQRLAGDDTQVHVVHVIYEGVADISTSAVEDSARLKTFILEAAEAELEDELERWRGRFKRLESATLWNPRAWEAVLHAAENADADLILRATGEQESVGERVVSVVRHAGRMESAQTRDGSRDAGQGRCLAERAGSHLLAGRVRRQPRGAEPQRAA